MFRKETKMTQGQLVQLVYYIPIAVKIKSSFLGCSAYTSLWKKCILLLGGIIITKIRNVCI